MELLQGSGGLGSQNGIDSLLDLARKRRLGGGAQPAPAALRRHSGAIVTWFHSALLPWTTTRAESHHLTWPFLQNCVNSTLFPPFFFANSVLLSRKFCIFGESPSRNLRYKAQTCADWKYEVTIHTLPHLKKCVRLVYVRSSHLPI